MIGLSITGSTAPSEFALHSTADVTRKKGSTAPSEFALHSTADVTRKKLLVAQLHCAMGLWVELCSVC
jgi:hypothetical protein